jgi:hypothetical protein
MPRPYADPEAAVRHLMETANAVEAVQGRIRIEKINGPLLFRSRARRPNTAPGSNAPSRTPGSNSRKRNFRDVHPGRGGPVGLIKNDGRLPEIGIGFAISPPRRIRLPQ